MGYVVKRTIGKNLDYLHAWDEQWGTSCMGSIKLALKFDTLADAQAAAVKAQSVCRGANGPAVGVNFEAVSILPDLYYTNQGLFTAFVPNTTEGENAWRELAGVTDNTGKIPSIQLKQFLYQLRKAGYTVTKAPKVEPLTADQLDDMLKELEG